MMRDTRPWRGASWSVLGVFLGVLLALQFSAAPASAEPTKSEDSIESWIADKAAFYEANPHLKDEKGSGWKPYNRFKWFYEQRGGDAIPVGARWRAWEQKRERERQNASNVRASWFALGPNNFAGRMLDIEFDPVTTTTVYAAAAGGGLWKSTNSGLSWTPKADDIPTGAVGAIAVLPSNPSIVLIGTGEPTNNVDRIAGVGVLKSTDGGDTWNTTSLSYTVNQAHGFHVMEVVPGTGTILAGATNGVWRSTDDGDTWTQIQVGDDYYDFVFQPGGSRIYTVKGNGGGANNVKVSTDDGLSWSKAGTGQPTTFVIGKSKLATTAANPSYIYAAFGNQQGGWTGVYRSTDDGTSWTVRSTSPNPVGTQGWYNLSLAADPNNAERIIVGGIQLYRSTNGGTTLGTIGGGVHVDHHAAKYHPTDPNRVFVGSDGGIWESTNDGTNWSDRNTDLSTFQFYDICVDQDDPNFIMGGTQDQGTDRWTGTTTWLQGLFADGMVCNINPNPGSSVAYAEIQFGSHYRSSNNGANWQQRNNGITGGGAWVTPVDEDQTPGNGGHLYTATSAGVFRTTDGMLNWVNVRPGNSANWISISPIDSDVVWTVAGNVSYTTNDGGSWTNAAAYGFIPLPGGATKILADPVDVNTAYVTFTSYADAAHIAKTTDLGASWIDITNDFVDQPVNAIAVDPLDTDRIFIGTDLGVWETTNGGTNWVPMEIGLPNTVVVDLEIQKSARKLVAGTHGRGAWEIDIGDDITDAPVSVATRLDMMFDNPYPNPVSDRAVLRFAAKSEGKVTLNIYDVAGRHVANVADLSRGNGIVQLAEWHTDTSPSGVYFAVLEANDQRLTRKVIVTK